MRALWAALAALGLCGLGAAALGAAAAGGATPASDGAKAAAAGLSAEGMSEIERPELAAAPAGTRAVLEQVLDRMESMRAELAELRADKAGVAALAERVTWLEDKRESSESADAALAERVAELEQAARRRMQGAEPEPEPEEYVHLLKRTATTGSACNEAACTPGGTTADGSFDYGV